MVVQIISDLHQEFGLSQLSFKNADVVVLAGDINIGVRGIKYGLIFHYSETHGNME